MGLAFPAVESDIRVKKGLSRTSIAWAQGARAIALTRSHLDSSRDARSEARQRQKLIGRQIALFGGICLAMKRAFFSTFTLIVLMGAASAIAQTAPKIQHAPKTAAEAPTGGAIRLIAALAPSDAQGVKSGIIWRVFNEHAEANGAHKLIAVSREASPTISLPEGAYIVHAAFGLAAPPAGSSSTGERSRSV